VFRAVCCLRYGCTYNCSNDNMGQLSVGLNDIYVPVLGIRGPSAILRRVPGVEYYFHGWC